MQIAPVISLGIADGFIELGARTHNNQPFRRGARYRFNLPPRDPVGVSGKLDHPSHLFPAVRGQVEHKYGEEGDSHAGDDEVHCVEEGLPPHCYVERDVEVRLITARVELFVSGQTRKSVIYGYAEALEKGS